MKILQSLKPRKDLGLLDRALSQLVLAFWGLAMIRGIIWAWDSGSLMKKVNNIVSSTFQIGSLSFSVRTILLAAFILYITRLIAVISRDIIKNHMGDKRFEPGLKDSISTIVSYCLWGIGLLVALAMLGVNATSLAVAFGALGVGIGFGLQNIINNFISGLILLFERPIQVGDTVEIGGVWSMVKQINARATVVQTVDNASVIIPNSEFISQRVTNWSFKDKRMRRNLDVKVAYGSDVDLVRQTLLDIAEQSPDMVDSCQEKTPPSALFFKSMIAQEF